MKTIILLSALALSACATTEPYTPTRNDRNFTVSVNYLPPSEVTKACALLGTENKNGCAAFNLDTKHCTIYVSPQRFAHDEERLAVIGHELDHCVHGRWHD